MEEPSKICFNSQMWALYPWQEMLTENLANAAYCKADSFSVLSFCWQSLFKISYTSPILDASSYSFLFLTLSELMVIF